MSTPVIQAKNDDNNGQVMGAGLDILKYFMGKKGGEDGAAEEPGGEGDSTDSSGTAAAGATASNPRSRYKASITG